MSITINSEALEKKEEPLYTFSIEKVSKSEWIDTGQVAPALSPFATIEENLINTSWTTEEKVFTISKPAYDIDEIYRYSSKFLFYLTFFTNYNYKIKRPLPIIIERGINPDIFSVGNEEMNKYGVGFSKEEALKDFEDFIIADYITLKKSSPEELSEDAKELLNLYDSYIQL